MLRDSWAVGVSPGLGFTCTEPNQPNFGLAFFILLHLTGTLSCTRDTVGTSGRDMLFSLLHIGEIFFSCHGDNPDSKKISYPRHGLFLDKKVQIFLPLDGTHVSDVDKGCIVD